MHQYIAEKKGGHLDSYLSMQSRINDKRSNYFMPKLSYNDLIQRYIGLKTLDKKIEFKKYCWNWIFQKWILKTDGIWTRRAQCACLFIQESPKILTSTDLQHGFGVISRIVKRWNYLISEIKNTNLNIFLLYLRELTDQE